MVWQTTAQVIRLEIMALIDNSSVEHKDIKALEKDWTGCTWYIISDETGQVCIEEA